MNRTIMIIWGAVAAVIVIFLVALSYGTTVDTLHADYSLTFTCEPNRKPTDDQMENMMSLQGFRVLNLEQARRANRRQFYDMDIIGIGQRDEMIRVMALPTEREGGFFAFSLHTPPPTKRNARLEAAMLYLVEQDLKCKVLETTQGENPAKAKTLYSRTLKEQENLFKEAMKK